MKDHFSKNNEAKIRANTENYYFEMDQRILVYKMKFQWASSKYLDSEILFIEFGNY